MTWRSAPLFILMGKNSEKPVKEKTRARFHKYCGVVFSFPTADETLCAFKKKFGRERPGEHVWAAKPHKHRGRSRPNLVFRPRPFFRANFRSLLFGGVLRRGLGERNVHLSG